MPVPDSTSVHIGLVQKTRREGESSIRPEGESTDMSNIMDNEQEESLDTSARVAANSAAGGAKPDAVSSESGYLLNYPITVEMLSKNSEEDDAHNVAYYSSYDRYIDNAAKRKQGRYTKAVSALIAIFAVFIIASASYLFVIFNTASSASAHTTTSVQQQKWGATDEDVEKLAAEGYEAIALTDNVEAFCKAFLTFDSESVEDGSWTGSFSSYVAPEDELVPIQENLIYVRSGESWREVFEVHPYFASKLVSCNQISWSILPTETVNVPYCDVYVETDRCPIVRYGLNSPDFSIKR